MSLCPTTLSQCPFVSTEFWTVFERCSHATIYRIFPHLKSSNKQRPSSSINFHASLRRLQSWMDATSQIYRNTQKIPFLATADYGNWAGNASSLTATSVCLSNVHNKRAHPYSVWNPHLSRSQPRQENWAEHWINITSNCNFDLACWIDRHVLNNFLLSRFVLCSWCPWNNLPLSIIRWFCCNWFPPQNFQQLPLPTRQMNAGTNSWTTPQAGPNKDF